MFPKFSYCIVVYPSPDADSRSQEGWLAENAVSEEDKLAAETAKAGADRPDDPMQGLEGLDVAGPKPA
jgi:hypothetical protein